MEGIRASARPHDTEQARWEAIASGDGLERRRDALECVAHYGVLPGQAGAGQIHQEGWPEQEEAHARQKREMEEAARAKKAEAEAKRELELRLANGGRLTAEELDSSSAPAPTPTAAPTPTWTFKSETSSCTVDARSSSRMPLSNSCTAPSTASSDATGLQSTLLHAIADRTIPMPEHLHIIHAEGRRLRARNPPFRRSSTPISSATICSKSRRSCWTRIRTRTRGST